jgi:hypothetical protein
MEYNDAKKLQNGLVEYEKPMKSLIKLDKKSQSIIIDDQTLILLHKQRKRIDSHCLKGKFRLKFQVFMLVCIYARQYFYIAR